MEWDSVADHQGGGDTSTNSQRLRAVISLARRRLTPLIHEVWSHPRLGELYPEFIFAMYGVTVASAPAMRAAAQRCGGLRNIDPLASWLQGYYLEHAEEEEGHGEWLLADLGSFGVSRERVLERLPYPSIAALVGSQYYWMWHVHPIAYLGYIAVLEAPAQMEFLQEVSKRTGIPLSSMSCHTRHAELDPGHVAEFDAALDSLHLNERHRNLITVSAITTIGHLEQVFKDILEHFERIGDPSAADVIFTATGPVLA
ncbi:MAG TPA: iron-containing redox enzyme family protein [Acidobacteriaceae bacterium]